MRESKTPSVDLEAAFGYSGADKPTLPEEPRMFATTRLAVALSIAGCLATQAVQTAVAQPLGADDLYRMRPLETRWASFENPTGAKGQAATANQGAKGNAYEVLKARESKVLLDMQGSGLIRRIWVTMLDKSPKMLRGTRLDMYWDGAKTPAVSVPLGDFFGHASAHMQAFQSDLFSSPTATSFNCFIPMPFRKAARVVITNETDADQPALFYDIDYTLGDPLDDDALYFHAHWRRENPTKIGRDFEILPQVSGNGRFLGSSIAVAAINQLGAGVEGEVKVYLDGDKDHPTLAGTGTEDYIGGGWGMDTFANRCQGCLVAKHEMLAFYRYHIPDPIFFHRDCRVTIQQMTGGDKAHIVKMAKAGLPMQVVGVAERGKNLTPLTGAGPEVKPEDAPDGFLIVYTIYDVSATAYFYLDRPENGLPALQESSLRCAGLK